MGNRFSKIYALGGTTMLMLSANSAMMILGAWSFHARIVAGYCGSLLSCLNFIAIITTGVLRYNNWGQLSAICDGPSKYVSGEQKVLMSDHRTVKGDASIITGLWICQIFFCLTNCCHIGHAVKPTEN